jgi:hypothetical protein
VPVLVSAHGHVTMLIRSSDLANSISGTTEEKK